MDSEFFPQDDASLDSAMTDEHSKRHFVYRTTSGQVILDTDVYLLPPPPGTVLRLPALPDRQEIIFYRVKDVKFVLEAEGWVTVYIEVEPDE